METTFKSIEKRTRRYIPIAHWSYKAYSRLHTETGTRTTVCLTCQTTCTVKHILIECRAFVVIRKRFFKVTSLTELFENIKIDDVLSFLRETGLYEKI